jgi:phosphate transport system protein
MSDHTSKQFDSELEAVRSSVLQMGGLVEEQINRAIEALASGDLASLDTIAVTGKQVNRMEIDLDEQCSHIIARRQPTAGDLRLLMTVIKVITDLERIGDEAEKIARMARLIHEAERLNMPRVELAHMSDAAIAMLRKALDSFARLDPISAAQVVRDDLALDDEYNSIMRQLITFMIEDPRTISRSIETLFIVKALERIGDHAKNMCEYTVYMVKGRDVRHMDVEHLEREAAQ